MNKYAVLMIAVAIFLLKVEPAVSQDKVSVAFKEFQLCMETQQKDVSKIQGQLKALIAESFEKAEAAKKRDEEHFALRRGLADLYSGFMEPTFDCKDDPESIKTALGKSKAYTKLEEYYKELGRHALSMARYVDITRSKLKEYGPENSASHEAWIRSDFVEGAKMDDKTFRWLTDQAKVRNHTFKRTSCESQARKLNATLGITKK